MENVNIGFMGAGGIARAHAFALQALRYHYNDVPNINLTAVTSRSEQSRKEFASKYGFYASPAFEDFIREDSLDTIFILGPNKVHYQHLEYAIQMPSVKRIYLEKPVCAAPEEEEAIGSLTKKHPDIKIQVGFQFLMAPALREAYNFWHSQELGRAIHFEVKYLHGDYLKESYREKRRTRLTAAPDGGAMADLGSHAISLMMAFLGEKVRVCHALQGGSFSDVENRSDLFSSLSLQYPEKNIVGTLSASRVSSGTGDTLAIDIYAEKGTLRYTTANPDFFEYYLEADQQWHRKVVGSQYGSITSFPSGHVPAGWLRSMMHAHYVFLGGTDDLVFVPDISHGLSVQSVVRQAAEAFITFRKQK